MSNQFLKLRRSAVAGRIPTTSSLDFGEIALNTYDGLAFMKKSGSSGEEIVTIGSTTGAFTGSFSGSFTGSLFGTASWAQSSSFAISASRATSSSFSTTASYAVTASYLNGYVSPFPYTGSAQITGSLGVTGSVSISGSTGTLLSANVDSIIFTGSFSQSGSVTVSGSVSVTSGITGSLFGTASWANNALTSSYILQAISASFASTSSNILGGAVNYIPLWNSATTLSSSVLYQSGSSIGINTTSPTSSLNVNQLAGTTKGIFISGDEIFTSGNGATNKGVRIALGVSRTSNRQLWMGDNDAFGSTTLSIFRYLTGATGYAALDSVTGDGATRLLTLIGTDTSDVGIGYDALSPVTASYVGKLNAFVFNQVKTNLYLKKSGSATGNFIEAFDTNNALRFRVDLNGNVSASAFTGSLLGTASFAATASSADNFTVRGTLTAQTIVAQVITSSTDFVTGSTRFGSLLSNTHQFTGSVSMTGSLVVNNSLITTGSFTVVTGSSIEFQVTNTGVKIGNAITDTHTVTGSLSVSGSVTATNFTGSLFGTASWAQNVVTASYILQAVSSSFATTASYAVSTSLAANSILLNNTGSSIFATTGSNVFRGNQTVTGSLFQSGSLIQIGNTTLSGSIIISGSVSASTNILLGGYLELDLGQDPGPNNSTASYLFTSASNTSTGFDLYYRQKNNLIKFKWIEGGISSGLLYGGVISYSGSTIFVKKGSGIITNMNASTGSEINPIFTYVNWNDYTASAQYITSSQNTYIYVNNTGTVSQQTSFFNQTQYEQAIPLGRVTHPNYVSITGVGSNVQTTYDSDTQQNDFIRAFGPIKVSGFSITPQTGSLRFGFGSGIAYNLGGFYTQDPNSTSHYEAAGFVTASIARAWRSGSGVYLDNNGGTFYTTVDPDYWDDGTGVLNTMSTGDWQIQRVFANPVTGRVVVYYGQNVYTTLINALQYLATDSFTEGEFTAHSLIFIGYLVLKGQTNNLTDTVNNRIIDAGIFRNIAGGSSGGGAVAQTLEDLSDVTITTPSNGQALIYNGGIWINGNPLSSSFATTASFTTTAISASYITSSGVFGPNGLNSILSSSFAQTASYVLNAISASFATNAANATTASYVLNAVSASFASTASFVVTAQTASYVLNAVSASFATQAANATTASYVLQAVSSSFATLAQTANTASYVVTAQTASFVTTAQTASFVTASNVFGPYGSSSVLSSSFAVSASWAPGGGGGSSAKAGSGSAASFGGTPRSSSITFGSAFSDNLYAVTVTGEDARSFTIQSKTSGSFIINSNSSVALTGPVYWIATAFN
jgi:hypothetical protein